jgi:Fe-S cluster biosynthesis and repair protein YggX
VDETPDDAGQRKPLNLADQRARQYLARQMENFFFGGGAEQPAGYVPPSN